MKKMKAKLPGGCPVTTYWANIFEVERLICALDAEWVAQPQLEWRQSLWSGALVRRIENPGAISVIPVIEWMVCHDRSWPGAAPHVVLTPPPGHICDLALSRPCCCNLHKG